MSEEEKKLKDLTFSELKKAYRKPIKYVLIGLLVVLAIITTVAVYMLNTI